jgi:hypothetical protein
LRSSARPIARPSPQDPSADCSLKWESISLPSSEPPRNRSRHPPGLLSSDPDPSALRQICSPRRQEVSRLTPPLSTVKNAQTLNAQMSTDRRPEPRVALLNPPTAALRYPAYPERAVLARTSSLQSTRPQSAPLTPSLMSASVSPHTSRVRPIVVCEACARLWHVCSHVLDRDHAVA